MYIQQVASRRFGGSITPPASSLLWYVNCNNPNYYREIVSGVDATTNNGVTGNATGGRFNGYNNSGANNAYLEWSGNDALQFKIDFSSSAWTIDMYVKIGTQNSGGPRIYIGNPPHGAGTDRIYFAVYYDAGWKIHCQTTVGNVAKLSIVRACANGPSTTEWKFFRIQYNPATTTLQMISGTTVDYTSAAIATNNFPNLTNIDNVMARKACGITADKIDNFACHAEYMANVEPTEEYTA